MTLEDLIAAKVVDRERPEHRARLLEVLRELEAEAGAPGGAVRTLLGELVHGGQLSREQAEWVHATVERHNRGRALGIFVTLLEREAGLPRAALEARVRGLGGAAESAALAEALEREGALSAERRAALQFQARRIYDADAHRQLEEFREVLGVARAAAGDEDASLEDMSSEEAKLPSGVYRQEVVLPRSEEMTVVVDRSALGDLSPPRFPIPSYVDTSDLLTGRQIGGFRVLGLIGRGAMAKVYLADHPVHEAPIALKLLPPDSSSERLARFKREILANGFFSHDNVIDVYDAGVAPEGHHYLAMEFFEGTDLEQVLLTEGSISLRQTLSLLQQLLGALAVAHQAGIVHRDIKPGNIMVDTAGSRAKLTDFGIALIKELGDFKDKVFESDDGGITGTPEYLSPEQAFRDPVGPTSDLYSLGMVAYRCLAGRLPFHSDSIVGWVNAHITSEPLPLDQAAPHGDWPPRLLRLFERLFVKDPTRRLSSAEEFLREVEMIALALGSGRRSRFFSRVRRGF